MFNNQLNAKNVTVSPMNVHFGKGQIFNITVDDVVAGGEFIKLEVKKPTKSDKDAVKKLALYFTVDSSGTVPAEQGYTNLEVECPATPTVSDITTALKVALDSDNDIRWCDVKDGLVRFQAKWHGKTADMIDGSTPTDYALATELEGFGGFLGGTQDGVDFSAVSEIEDIPVDQKGGAPLTSTFKKTDIEIKTKVIELDKPRFNLLYGRSVGTVMTPQDGTEIVGFGTNKVGQSAADLTGELILLPLDYDGDNPDYSEAFFFFEAMSVPGALKLDNNVKALEVTFKVYTDSTKITEADYGLMGDGFQSGLRV